MTVTELTKQLIHASKIGDLNLVKSLSHQWEDIHVNYDLPFRLAADQGHLDLVKYYVEEQGVRVDASSDNDHALIWASANGHGAVVSYLLAHGADVSVMNNSALNWAIEGGHTDIVNTLIDHNINIHANNNSALHCAAVSGQFEIAEQLFAKGSALTKGEFKIYQDTAKSEFIISPHQIVHSI